MKNHLRYGLLCGSLALLLFACTTPEMAVAPDLRQAGTSYAVQGRNGWLINQRLTFGEYQTGKVNRSWIKGYDLPFVVRFTGAKEKLSYELWDDNDNRAEILCLGKLREQDLQLFHRYFDLNLKTRDAFTGTVVLAGDDAFDFYVANLNQNQHVRRVEGMIQGKDVAFLIRPVARLANQRMQLSEQALGFEFVLADQVLGAVETLNQGKIWLRNDLTDRQRLVLTSVASALLLRSDLTEHNDPAA